MSKNSLITAEARGMIGKQGEPITGEVHEKEIRRFCYAVGDLNPFYLDDEDAKKSRYGGVVAPPMFYDIPTIQEFPLEELKEDGIPNTGFHLPLKATRTMAGGKEVEFFKPMRPGDRITQVGKIVDIYEKGGRSGPLVFTIFENRYTNQDGELVAVERLTNISW
ncbi:MaoC family dehydratase N-terminal domain-containing protein [Thermodesulfobacteriota bacterium]